MILIYFLSSCLPVLFFLLVISLLPFCFSHTRDTLGIILVLALLALSLRASPSNTAHGGFTVACGKCGSLEAGRLAKFICWVNGKRKALDLADGSVDMARNGLG